MTLMGGALDQGFFCNFFYLGGGEGELKACSNVQAMSIFLSITKFCTCLHTL